MSIEWETESGFVNVLSSREVGDRCYVGIAPKHSWGLGIGLGMLLTSEQVDQHIAELMAVKARMDARAGGES